MASPAVHLHKYHKVHAKQGGIEGCDHDQSVYHYRLVDGAMVLRGIALGPRWETRQMDWQGLSCYKRKEDEQMAKRQAPPYEELKQVFIDAEYKIDRVRKVLKVNWLDAKQWLKDAGLIDSDNWPTDKVTTSKDEPIRSMGCIEPELSDKATEVVTAPIGVEVPDYEDDGDLEASPYIIKPDPLIAQLGVAIDIIHAERKARTLALIAPIAANADALAMIRDLFDKGLL